MNDPAVGADEGPDVVGAEGDRTRRRWLIAGGMFFVGLGLVLAFMRLRSPGEFVDGQTWDDVVARPDWVGKDLDFSGGRWPVHSIEIGTAKYWECWTTVPGEYQSPFATDQSYQGQLRIVHVETPGRITSHDRIEFVTGDKTMRFSAIAPGACG